MSNEAKKAAREFMMRESRRYQWHRHEEEADLVEAFDRFAAARVEEERRAWCVASAKADATIRELVDAVVATETRAEEQREEMRIGILAMVRRQPWLRCTCGNTMHAQCDAIAKAIERREDLNEAERGESVQCGRCGGKGVDPNPDPRNFSASGGFCMTPLCPDCGGSCEVKR